MGGLGILILPALGGYLFLTSANYFKFTVFRQSGYHVALASAVAGLPLLIASSLIVDQIIPANEPFGTSWADHLKWLQHLVASKDDAAAVPAILSVGLGSIAAIGWNRLYDGWSLLNFSWNSAKEPRSKLLSKALVALKKALAALKGGRLRGAVLAGERRGAIRELLIAEAQEEGDLIEVTLRDDKTYVGYVLDSGIARRGAEDAELALLPLLSGYRNDRGELILTSRYAKHLAKLSKQDEEVTQAEEEGLEARPDQDWPAEVAKMRIAIAMSEVQRVRFFDFGLYLPPEGSPEMREIGDRAENCG